MWSVLSLKYKRKIDLHLTTESKWNFSVRKYFGGGGVPYVPAFVARTKFVISKFELSNFRSSRLQVFFKIRVLKNFAYFTGKHMCRNLFLKKVAGRLKKGLQHGSFPVIFAKFLKKRFLENTSGGCFCYLLIWNTCRHWYETISDCL